MPQERLVVRIAGITDTGMRRKHNEDHIQFDQDLGIAVLADGMGGHQAGEIAAHMAVEAVMGKLQSLFNGDTAQALSSSQLCEFVSNTISHSNNLIYLASEALEERKGMGTTLVTAVIHGSKMIAGHVGDSRLYLFRNRALSRITRDHSLVQDLIDKGFYTEEEAKIASVGHIVTRALGTKAEVEVDTVQQDVEPNDLLLLCSDGLSDMVPDWRIGEVLVECNSSLEATAKHLVELANLSGGKDNISVILMQVQAS